MPPLSIHCLAFMYKCRERRYACHRQGRYSMCSGEFVFPYLERLFKNADRCHHAQTRGSYLFLLISLAGWLAVRANSATVTLFGASLSVPLTLVEVGLPVVLAFVFHYIASFAALEDSLYEEIRTHLKNLQRPSGEETLLWKSELLEAPSYYSWPDVQATLSSSPGCRVFNKVLSFILLICYIFLFPAVIGYFLVSGFSSHPTWYLGCLYLMASLLVVYSIAHFFTRSSPTHKGTSHE